MNIFIIIGSCVSLATSLVAIVVVITNLRANVDALKTQEERITLKIEGAAQQFTDLLVVVKSFISVQTVVNEHLADALRSVVMRCDECRAQHLKQDSTAQLLAEMLKHKQIVDIG